MANPIPQCRQSLLEGETYHPLSVSSPDQLETALVQMRASGFPNANMDQVCTNNDGTYFILVPIKRPPPTIGTSDIGARLKDILRKQQGQLPSLSISGLFRNNTSELDEYLQSIIRSNDYSSLVDQRPFSWQLRFSEPPKSNKKWIETFPGYNQMGEGVSTELVCPASSRPASPFEANVRNHKKSPFYAMVTEAAKAHDTLDAVGYMIQWLKEKITYRVNNLDRSPELVLADGFGDCDDYAKILEMVGNWVGIKCPMTYGAFYESNFHHTRGWAPHAWNMLKIGDTSIPVDTALGTTETQITGDWLWQTAKENVWIPLTQYGMENWDSIMAISPTQVVETVDFEISESTPQDIDAVERHLAEPANALRQFLIGEGYAEEIFTIDGIGSDTADQSAIGGNLDHYRALYLEHVLVQWLENPYTVSDPLNALDRMVPLYSQHTSPELVKPLQGIVLVLLAGALGDAEDERFVEKKDTVLVSADALYNQYQSWNGRLNLQGGYADLFLKEWERRLSQIYMFDELEVPTNLDHTQPEYAFLLKAVTWIHDDRTPETLRQETDDYISTRNSGPANLTQDAIILENWRDDLAFHNASPEDRDQLGQLLQTMTATAKAPGQDSDRISSLLPREGGGLSMMALIELRQIASREMARHRIALGSDKTENLHHLEESLAWYSLAHDAKVDIPVMGEIGNFQDGEAIANAPVLKEESANWSRPQMGMSKSGAVGYSIRNVGLSYARLQNETVSQEIQIKDLDEKSLNEMNREIHFLMILAHRVYVQQVTQTTRDSAAITWLAEYKGISGTSDFSETQFAWEDLALFVSEEMREKAQTGLQETYPNRVTYSLKELSNVLSSIDTE